MKLTVKSIEAAWPESKPYKMYDGAGLYLEVRPTGQKFWRQDVYMGGKQKRLSFGVLPMVGLKEARLGSYEVRAALVNGEDPSQGRKEGKKAAQNVLAEAVGPQAYLLKGLFHVWISWKRQTWSVPYARRFEERVRSSALRFTGEIDTEEVSRADFAKLRPR